MSKPRVGSKKTRSQHKTSRTHIRAQHAAKKVVKGSKAMSRAQATEARMALDVEFQVLHAEKMAPPKPLLLPIADSSVHDLAASMGGL